MTEEKSTKIECKNCGKKVNQEEIIKTIEPTRFKLPQQYEEKWGFGLGIVYLCKSCHEERGEGLNE